ncbi:hypothetical protein ACEE94_10570 [Staphylococcus epidermidis]
MYEYEDVKSTVETSIKNISFYNAYKIQEHLSRENEILKEAENLKNLEAPNFILEANKELNNEYDTISNMSEDEQKELYKDLLNMQDQYNIYSINNDTSSDLYISVNRFKTAKKLDYMEKEILTDTDKYSYQLENNKDVLNSDNLNASLEKNYSVYKQYSQEIYESKNSEQDQEILKNKANGLLADRKILEHNKNFVQENKEKLTDVVTSKEQKLENKIKEAEKINELLSNDIMWKIVEEQGKNSQYLTKDDDNTLDARANSDNIYKQISTNNSAQYSNTQTIRNTSYTNAYSSLQKSQRISNANYTQSQENETNKRNNQDEIEEKRNKNQNRGRGMTL